MQNVLILYALVFSIYNIKLSRRRWKTVLVLRLTFSDYGTARKKPWQYALKFFKTIQPRSFHFLAMLTTADFYSHNSQFHFLSHNPNDMKQWHATLSCLSSTAWGKVLLFVGCRLTDQKKHHSLICRTILFAYSTARKNSLM